MIYRKKYIDEIRGFYNSDLIKIITGVRRCGKSVILEQIMNELKTLSDNIIYLDFEDRAVTSSIVNWKAIVDHVQKNRKGGLCYVFLDEVQEIEGWAMAVRSLRRENCSVFITGSNSKLLSREFTKELSGRYVSFRIRPFVFKELTEYARELNKEITVTDYLIWGGFPKRIEFDSLNDLRRYINDLDETIVMNDIINRYKIRKSEEFKKLANYILISNARIYSAKSIADYMNSNGVKCGSNTVQKWIGYLDEAYVIDEAPRYSRKAKKELEQSKKLYDCDVALNSIRCTDNRYDLTHNMENIVYNELIYMGYSVSVYDNNGREIDFLAEKNGLKYYVQAAYSVAEEKAYQREFSAFGNIGQTDKRIIITNDEIDYSTSTVEHIRLKDFLMMDDLTG
ncbi:MAG: ATP-binding protein [Lachnospiraceae bacterium]|jgi:predicted AAA+ superfamily ATPase|nr:ATP-binding protein [Lachnospiraceae bacterium]